MTTRPILFSAPMVLAILDGNKTQTRRITKFHEGQDEFMTELRDGSEIETVNACPYGIQGDQLWVRETWQSLKPWGIGYELCNPAHMEAEIHYRATAEKMVPELPWRPSIFMPRFASRITLEITGIRVERLHNITEADAKAEGCCATGFVPSYRDPDNNGGADEYMSARDNYCELWESINGPGSWDSNPFVWVIEFNRIKP